MTADERPDPAATTGDGFRATISTGSDVNSYLDRVEDPIPEEGIPWGIPRDLYTEPARHAAPGNEVTPEPGHVGPAANSALAADVDGLGLTTEQRHHLQIADNFGLTEPAEGTVEAEALRGTDPYARREAARVADTDSPASALPRAAPSRHMQDGHIDPAAAARWHQAQTELVDLIHEENQAIGQEPEADLRQPLPGRLGDWMETRVAELEQAEASEPEAEP